ncbi:MAG TPA: rhomboid family intramembrane serine protease [Gemmataceae bacterium]|nr:rhomboid family intramembrane serine protease [Gemmataceae bacterium]
MNPYEAILRMCAAAWPKPWYPRAYAQSAGVPQEQLYYYIENLWLDGLVQKGESTPETGPGLTLTAAGRDVLEDPAALQRLTQGRAVKPGDQGAVVREALRLRTRPRVTLGIIAVNVAAFLYTVYLASQAGVATDYIGLTPFSNGNPAAQRKLEELLKKPEFGAVYGPGWIDGKWWLLLTSCFIHFGALHILGNMYVLYRIGGEVERWWGPVRYLVIYLFAGLGGSCLALGLEPRIPMAGASGAICGILGAAAVWALCNGRYLPAAIASQIRRNLLINGVLLVFVSFLPGVSWQGHLGGAVVGAAVALVMQVQRFGPYPWRWLVLATLVPLPWLGWAFINYERQTNPVWKDVRPGAGKQGGGRSSKEERKDFDDSFIDRLNQAIQDGYTDVWGKERDLLTEAPDKRNPDRVKAVKRNVDEQRGNAKELAEDLTKAGPYKDEKTETCRAAAMHFTQALVDFLNTVYARLSANSEWTMDDAAKAAAVRTALDELERAAK